MVACISGVMSPPPTAISRPSISYTLAKSSRESCMAAIASICGVVIVASICEITASISSGAVISLPLKLSNAFHSGSNSAACAASMAFSPSSSFTVPRASCISTERSSSPALESWVVEALSASEAEPPQAIRISARVSRVRVKIIFFIVFSFSSHV